MSTQKYAGRHRPRPPSPAGEKTPGLLAADVAHGSGRHRASTSSTWSVPRIAGTGMVLPTAAAATLVLTATGAHLGPSTGNLAPRAVRAEAQTAATLADHQQTQGIEVSALAAESLAAQQRADRTTQRERVAAVAAETVRRQAEEQARTEAAGRAIAIDRAPVAPRPHEWVPYLDTRCTLTSGFGMRWGAMHPGQDFAIPVGTPVMAMSTGTVLLAEWSGGYGNKVEIQYWDGTVSWMAHNSALKVTKGQQVSPGEVVALSGNTGHSTGPHSHLEIHPKGDETNAGAIPPIPWLDGKGIMPGSGGATTAPGPTD